MKNKVDFYPLTSFQPFRYSRTFGKIEMRNKIILTLTLAEWDITHAGGCNMWRLFSFKFSYSHFFMNLFLDDFWKVLNSTVVIKTKLRVTTKNIQSIQPYSFRKNNFTVYCLHRDQPPAWELSHTNRTWKT